jgi:metal-dependent amidase/aminoacylase/carboxypeptidase family protein
MFGAGSLGAAVAIKIDSSWKTKRNYSFYGTPAEEDLAGKVYGKSRII